MLVDYLIVTSAVAIASLVWWVFLDDYPAIHARVKNLPLIGKPLDCSFCFPMWLTFVAMFFFQPLAIPVATLFPMGGIIGVFGRFALEWFAVGAGVLFVRHTIFAIREIGAVFNHRHRKNHEKDAWK